MQLSIFAVVFGSASSAIFHAPLFWKRSEMVEMVAKGRHADYKASLESLRKGDATGVMGSEEGIDAEILGRIKYAKPVLAEKALKYTTYAQLYQLGSEYFQQITIGRPEQYPFWMWLTTFTSMMWITTSQCKSPICDQMKKFDPDSSTTFTSLIDPWRSVGYDGVASGQRMGTDEMRLGGVHESQQFILRAQFGVATRVNVTQDKIHSDGTIGLAFGEYNNTKGLPFIINAVRKGYLDKPVFTIWLKRYPVIGDSQGVITYGDIDTYNCGPVFQYENITSDMAYIYTIDSISMGTWLYRMRFDVEISLSSFIFGPEYIVKLFAKDAGVEIGDDGEYYIDCEAKFNNLEISSGDTIYNISYRKLIIQVDEKTCLFAFLPWRQLSPFRPTWYIGAPLLRQYCVVFDIEKRRVGFADHVPDDQKSSTIRPSTPSRASTITSAKCVTRLLTTIAIIIWQFLSCL